MNILLYAFIDTNLGDDIFIQIIANRYQNINFYLPIDKKNDSHSLSQLSNVYFSSEFCRIYEKLKRESILKNHFKINFSLLNKEEKTFLHTFDASVYIVGSAFIQRKAHKDFSNLILLEKMVNHSKKFFMINTNFGPYVDKKYLEYSKKVISKMTDICFRDKYSYKLFSDLDNVRLASDIVLSLKDDIKVTNNTVIISIMDLGKEYLSLINILITIFQSKKLEVKLVSFCKNQNDELAASKLNNPNAEIIKYEGNIPMILDEFKKAEAIIATRFHSMILAFAYNKPVLPIIYSQKTLKVIEDANFNGNYIELDKISTYNLEKIIEELLSNPSTINEAYKNNASLQFAALDKFIGKENEI